MLPENSSQYPSLARQAVNKGCVAYIASNLFVLLCRVGMTAAGGVIVLVRARLSGVNALHRLFNYLFWYQMGGGLWDNSQPLPLFINTV